MITTQKARKRFISKRTPRGTKRCWNWQAGSIRGGYGSFSIGKQRMLSHRLSYTLAHGAIPDGMCVLHLCHNPKCVSPHHLIVGTHSDNMRMMHEAGRRGSRKRKMDADKVRELRRLRSEGWTYDALALRYGISQPNARAIANRTTWRWVDTMDGEYQRKQ